MTSGGASSSFHSINGDEPLDPWQKLRYVLAVLRENVEASLSDRGLEAVAYQPRLDCGALERHFGPAIHTFSSNRVLCSDFMIEVGRQFLPEQPRIIDLGCGNGAYSGFLRSIFAFESYLGIDKFEFSQWTQHAGNGVAFRSLPLGDSVIDVSDYDSIFSISALEHIRADRRVFLNLRSRDARRLHHLHLIPGLPSFFQYRLHGYRRYCLKYIESLTSIDGVSEIRVFGIGNRISRRVAVPKAGRHLAGQAGSNGGESALDVLVAHRTVLAAADVREAPFLAVTFFQQIVPSSRENHAQPRPSL